MRSSRLHSHLSFLLILLCLSALLVGWHQQAASAGKTSPPERLVLAMFYYPQLLLSRLGTAVSEQWQTLTAWRNLARENRALRQRVKTLESEKRQLLRYLAENQHLRRLLDLQPNLPRPSAAAEVIASDVTNWFRRVWVSRGSRDGVQVKDVVVAPDGLVGQVLRVTPRSSYVLLLTDAESRVGARIIRSGAVGIVEGTGQRVCQMTRLDWRADVREGDLVMTSGQSQIFPKGILIGRVVAVRKDAHLSTQTATIEPSVPFEKLDHVFVLKKNGQ
ncbi:MAG: rod shape-determining protein MreC [Abditibacteriales bacterium]|nr:rod shape-determining protein MreC [Abditibacteriales bacterium]MDW8368223.1 rod shape-determining protein MreC [Abditibacteriales bacterium]